MQIEFLYFDDCASYQDARAILDDALVTEGIAASIEMIKVQDEEDAVKKHFVGSPTLRVNGSDLFPEQTSGAYAMQCRVYRTPHGFQGAPTHEMMRAALRAHVSRP